MLTKDLETFIAATAKLRVGQSASLSIPYARIKSSSRVITFTRHGRFVRNKEYLTLTFSTGDAVFLNVLSVVACTQPINQFRSHITHMAEYVSTLDLPDRETQRLGVVTYANQVDPLYQVNRLF